MEPDVIFRLGLVVGPGLMLLYSTAVVFMLGYRITRRGHEENLDLLVRRG